MEESTVAKWLAAVPLIWSNVDRLSPETVTNHAGEKKTSWNQSNPYARLWMMAGVTTKFLGSDTNVTVVNFRAPIIQAKARFPFPFFYPPHTDRAASPDDGERTRSRTDEFEQWMSSR